MSEIFIQQTLWGKPETNPMSSFLNTSTWARTRQLVFLSCFVFWPRHEARGILMPPHWKRRVLTTGPPGKSLAAA